LWGSWTKWGVWFSYELLATLEKPCSNDTNHNAKLSSQISISWKFYFHANQNNNARGIINE